MPLPKWAKETFGLICEFASALIWCAVGVILLTFLALGFTTVWGLSGNEALELYTPLLLGLFSIAITLYLFQRNIREGRDRALRERNDAVRPILIMQTVSSSVDERIDRYECFHQWTLATHSIVFEIENVGLGTALNICFVVEDTDFKFYRSSPQMHKLVSGEKKKFQLVNTLGKKISEIITEYEDVYCNDHHCVHALSFEKTGKSSVYANEYASQTQKDKDIMIEWCNVPVFTRERAFTRENKTSKESPSE